MRYEQRKNHYYHHSEQLICHRAHYSSLGAGGAVGAAERGIKRLSDECALGVFIALTVRRRDDDRWTQESGENQVCSDLVLTDRIHERRGKVAPLLNTHCLFQQSEQRPGCTIYSLTF